MCELHSFGGLSDMHRGLVQIWPLRLLQHSRYELRS
jgi:hypothetical protein